MKTRIMMAMGVVCLAGPPAVAATGTRPFQLEDLQRLVSLRDPQISPDGRQIAVIVARWDFKADKSKPEIDLVDVASGAIRTLTQARMGLASPRWSTDGAKLAFIADSPKAQAKEDSDPGATASDNTGDGKPQVFVMPMDGGDPAQITHSAEGVASYAWSPDSQRIAFVSQEEAPNAKAIKAHDDGFEVTDNNFQARATANPWRLWIVSAVGGAATRLTNGAYSLHTDQGGGAGDPVFDASGNSIAYTRFPGAWWGPSFKSVIALISPAGTGGATVIDAPGAHDPEFAPVGDALAYQRPRDGDQNNGEAVYVSSGGHDLDVTRSLARNIGAFRWLPDGKTLLLSGDDGTHAAFWLQPLDGKARKLALGAVEPGARFSVARTAAVAFIGSTQDHADELYVMTSPDAAPRRLTDLNDVLEGVALGRTQPLDWRGPGGFAEDGVLTFPPSFAPGRKYPLVLVIHGGPAAASTVRFSPLPQLLAAAGFVVFQPNYRGSTNLGDAYQHAIFRDTGQGPGEDVMAGLAAVQKLGFVDPARIGVSGWSYGGYMTTWLTSHANVWKAAVAGAALTDWVMDYTVAFYQEGDVYLFGGSPWTAKYRDIWRAQSPINYAQNVTAPTLIMGDVGDPNVPLLNSYEWYHALRDHGVEVKFFAYPVNTHFPQDVVRTTDVYRRWVDWMVTHLE